MPATAEKEDFLVTDEKIDALVQQIAVAANPWEIIVFGSRARGDQRPESDLDLAVITEDESSQTRRQIHEVSAGRTMAVDLLIISRARFDEFRPWINTIERQIDREGVRRYVRGQQPTHSEAA